MFPLSNQDSKVNVNFGTNINGFIIFFDILSGIYIQQPLDCKAFLCRQLNVLANIFSWRLCSGRPIFSPHPLGSKNFKAEKGLALAL